jgi:hypothetical protein
VITSQIMIYEKTPDGLGERVNITTSHEVFISSVNSGYSKRRKELVDVTTLSLTDALQPHITRNYFWCLHPTSNRHVNAECYRTLVIIHTVVHSQSVICNIRN